MAARAVPSQDRRSIRNTRSSPLHWEMLEDCKSKLPHDHNAYPARQRRQLERSGRDCPLAGLEMPERRPEVTDLLAAR